MSDSFRADDVGVILHDQHGGVAVGSLGRSPQVWGVLEQAIGHLVLQDGVEGIPEIEGDDVAVGQV